MGHIPEVEMAVADNEKGETSETSESPPGSLDRVCQEVGELLLGLQVEIPSERATVRDTGESTAQENN